MVEIQSKEAIDKMSQELKVQPSMALPRTLMNTIQPTFDINTERVVNTAARATAATTGGVDLFVTPSDRDFFMTGLGLTFSCDATADSTVYRVSVTLAGKAAVNIIEVQKQTTTADSQTHFREFTVPVLLERGTALRLIQVFTVGTSVSSGMVQGFTTDPE